VLIKIRRLDSFKWVTKFINCEQKLNISKTEKKYPSSNINMPFSSLNVDKGINQNIIADNTVIIVVPGIAGISTNAVIGKNNINTFTYFFINVPVCSTAGDIE
jgi:hypothetical protein